jgi:hypothetical protein
VETGHIEHEAQFSVLPEESFELGHKVLVIGLCQLPADVNHEHLPAVFFIELNGHFAFLSFVSVAAGASSPEVAHRFSFRPVSTSNCESLEGPGFAEARELVDAGVQALAQRVVAHGKAIHRDDRIICGQASHLREAKQGRDEFAPRQIAGSAKNNKNSGFERVISFHIFLRNIIAATKCANYFLEASPAQWTTDN